MLRRLALGLAMAMAIGSQAFADDTTTPAPAPVPPAPDATVQQPSDSHLAAAIELLETTHAKTNMEAMIDAILPAAMQNVQKGHPGVSQAVLDAFTTALHDEMEDSLGDVLKLEAHVYAEHFSEDELRQLTQFYKSDLGQKYLSQVPVILKETAPITAAWGRTMAQNAMRKALEKLQKTGVQL